MAIGPLIEGVVSPTASSTTRRSALDSITKTQGKRPDPYQSQYYATKGAFQGGANTALAAQIGTTARNQATIFGGSPIGNARDIINDYVAQGILVRNPDGTIYNPNTGVGTPPAGPGGGGDGTTPTGPPTGPGGPGGEENPDLGQVSREAIEAQINALTAQYGLDLESIAALGGEIGAQARFLMAQLNRDEGFAQERQLGQLVGRGIFRSGVTARDTARLQGDFALKRAQVEQDKGARLRQLAERAGVAKVGLARGKADVISQIDQGNLTAEIRQALLNELNSLTPQQIQGALDATRQPTPPLNIAQAAYGGATQPYAGGQQPQQGLVPVDPYDEELQRLLNARPTALSGLAPVLK